jgi:hypothetical protein
LRTSRLSTKKVRITMNSLDTIDLNTALAEE